MLLLGFLGQVRTMNVYIHTNERNDLNVDQLRRDSSALNVIAIRINEVVQENPVLDRVAGLADYLAAVNHDTETGDNIAADAKLLRAGDVDAIQRWSLWLGTIATNADKPADTTHTD